MRNYQIIVAFMMTLMLILPSKISAQTYDVSYKNQTVEQVTKDLRSKTGYQFAYKKEVVQGAPRITCEIRKATFTQLLNRIFYDIAGLNYEIVKGTVILTKASKNRPYFKKLVTGMVTDTEDQPLPGASVVQVGTTNGVSSDVDGNFSLMVEGNGPELEISYIGMKSRKIQINKSTGRFVMIKLESDE